jgi:hypothetical protein
VWLRISTDGDSDVSRLGFCDYKEDKLSKHSRRAAVLNIDLTGYKFLSK